MFVLIWRRLFAELVENLNMLIMMILSHNSTEIQHCHVLCWSILGRDNILSVEVLLLDNNCNNYTDHCSHSARDTPVWWRLLCSWMPKLNTDLFCRLEMELFGCGQLLQKWEEQQWRVAFSVTFAKQLNWELINKQIFKIIQLNNLGKEGRHNKCKVMCKELHCLVLQIWSKKQNFYSLTK